MRVGVFLLWVIVALAAHAEVRYRVVRIETPVTNGVPEYANMIAHAINNGGEIVGTYTGSDSEGEFLTWGFHFSDTNGPRILDLLPEFSFTRAQGINDAGQIAIVAGTGSGERGAYRYTPGIGVEPLGSFGGGDNEALAINSMGQVAGYSELTNSDVYSFRYTDTNGLENLGGLFGEESDAWAINDSGWVAGSSAEHAYLYRDDLGMIDLGPGQAYGINNRGDVVGRAFLNDSTLTGEEAFLYRDGTKRLLGRIPDLFGEGNTRALDINNPGVVVGEAYIFDLPFNPRVAGMIWTELEGMKELNAFVSHESGLYVITARAINDHGQITGRGAFDENGTPNFGVTFRLDPIPPLMSISRSSTNAIVSWSPAWPGIVLEAASDLTLRDWQPVETGSTNVVHLPLTGASRFFRLNLDGIRGLCCVPEESEE